MTIPNLVDYKNLLKSIGLTLNQKKILFAFCEEPTKHPYSSDYKSRHGLTSGGITVALKRLQRFELIIKDAGVWRLRNQGMQKWLFAVRSRRPTDEIESLRHVTWQFSDDFRNDRENSTSELK